MNALGRTARLVAAAASASLTAALFAAVVSFAEPQRSSLIAKNAEHHKRVAGPPTLQVANAGRAAP